MNKQEKYRVNHMKTYSRHISGVKRYDNKNIEDNRDMSILCKMKPFYANAEHNYLDWIRERYDDRMEDVKDKYAKCMEDVEDKYAKCIEDYQNAYKYYDNFDKEQLINIICNIIMKEQSEDND